jgi:dethiobiotin synthase
VGARGDPVNLELAPVVVVTGTDTDVGKTVATAALAAVFASFGATAAVYKPTQTGADPDSHGDVQEAARLAGIHSATEGVRLRAAMAPVPAARLEGRMLPALGDHVGRIQHLATRHDRVFVEGAGGVLVRLDAAGNTIADVAHAAEAPAVVVCRSGLGTLNHTELTLEALARRGIAVAGVVIGSWPAEPSDVELSNREHLSSLGVPLLGAIPAHASQLVPTDFQRRAPTWLDVAAGGHRGSMRLSV